MPATAEPRPDWTADAVIAWLRARANPDNAAGMARYGIGTGNALGVRVPALRGLARQIGRDHARARQLWEAGIRETRLLAVLTDEPAQVTFDQAWAMAGEMADWEIVDQSADLFRSAGLASRLIEACAQDNRPLVKRLGFALIVACAIHCKKAPDTDILAWLPLIEAHAGDDRRMVEKAVCWALRQIGKRSRTCHTGALSVAERLAASDMPAARRTGRTALTELLKPNVKERAYHRP